MKMINVFTAGKQNNQSLIYFYLLRRDTCNILKKEMEE